MDGELRLVKPCIHIEEEWKDIEIEEDGGHLLFDLLGSSTHCRGFQTMEPVETTEWWVCRVLQEAKPERYDVCAISGVIPFDEDHSKCGPIILVGL